MGRWSRRLYQQNITNVHLSSRIACMKAAELPMTCTYLYTAHNLDLAKKIYNRIGQFLQVCVCLSRRHQIVRALRSLMAKSDHQTLWFRQERGRVCFSYAIQCCSSFRDKTKYLRKKLCRTAEYFSC